MLTLFSTTQCIKKTNNMFAKTTLLKGGGGQPMNTTYVLCGCNPSDVGDGGPVHCPHFATTKLALCTVHLKYRHLACKVTTLGTYH